MHSYKKYIEAQSNATLGMLLRLICANFEIDSILPSICSGTFYQKISILPNRQVYLLTHQYVSLMYLKFLILFVCAA